MKLDWHAETVLKEVARIAAEVATEGGEDVATDARRLCPVETDGDHPGTLKGSIRVEKSKFGGSVVLAGGKGSWGDAFYAPFVELGTPGTTYRSGKRKGGHRVSIKAKSFLRKALKRNKSKLRQKFQKALS